LLSAIAFILLATGARATDVAQSQEVVHLRGAETAAADNAERDLASAGVTQYSSSQKFFKCMSSSDCCFDCNQWCNAYVGSCVFTAAVGTQAYAMELLCAYAECEAAAAAWAQSYAIVYGSTNVNIKASTYNNYCTDIDVKMSLLTASVSITIAASQATAAATVQASSFGIAYTDATVACKDPTVNKTALCTAAALSGGIVAGTASAGSYSGGLTGAIAGSSTATYIDVDASGTGVTQVAACLASFASSFSFSASSVNAMAQAYTATINANLAVACVTAYQKYCVVKGAMPFCSVPQATACSLALAYADAKGCAVSFAAACAKSFAVSSAAVIIQATAKPNGICVLKNGAYGEACVQSFCALGP